MPSVHSRLPSSLQHPTLLRSVSLDIPHADKVSHSRAHATALKISTALPLFPGERKILKVG